MHYTYAQYFKKYFDKQYILLRKYIVKSKGLRENGYILQIYIIGSPAFSSSWCFVNMKLISLDYSNVFRWIVNWLLVSKWKSDSNYSELYSDSFL